jgi:hypothetical protein
MRIELQIRRDGDLSTVELDLDIEHLSGQELERVQEVTSEEQRTIRSARFIRAAIWAKLIHTPYASVAFDEIDYDFTELLEGAETAEEQEWVTDDDESVVIPMETTTGTVEAEVSLGG